MLEQLFPLGFLAIFQIIGGAAVGNGLRTVIVNRSPAGLGLVYWGLMFGGIPSVIGAALAFGTGYGLLALVGPAIFIGAALFSMTLLQKLSDILGPGVLYAIIFGSVFMFVGILAGTAMVRSDELFGGLIFGVIFFLVGALVCGSGIMSLINDKPSNNVGNNFNFRS